MSRFLAALLCAVLSSGCTTTGYLVGRPPESSGFVSGDHIPDPPEDLDVGFRNGSFEVAPTFGERLHQTFIGSSGQKAQSQPAVDGPGIGVTSNREESSPPVTPQPANPKTQQAEASRLQIYSGSFQVSTTDIDSSASRLIAMVKEKNGYLQSRTDAVVVCRVPSANF